jgi:DNA-directed RNA polymerase specialized sigma24 family protein
LFRAGWKLADADKEDIVAEAIRKIMVSSGGFGQADTDSHHEASPSEGQAKQWLYSVIRSVAIDHARRRNPKPPPRRQSSEPKPTQEDSSEQVQVLVVKPKAEAAHHDRRGAQLDLNRMAQATLLELHRWQQSDSLVLQRRAYLMEERHLRSRDIVEIVEDEYFRSRAGASSSSAALAGLGRADCLRAEAALKEHLCLLGFGREVLDS